MSEVNERHVYLVGEFFAKYHGDLVPGMAPGARAQFLLETYDRKVSHARYVFDPEMPACAEEGGWMRADLMKEVVVLFEEDPAGYGKPYREEFRNVLVADIRLEGVVKERKRTYGTLRGQFYAKVHTTVM